MKPPQVSQGQFQPVARGLEARRTQVERIEGMAGQVTTVHGFIELEGAGELTIPVKFPIRFIEKPSFSFGAEMAENEQIVVKKFPTCSGVVLTWAFGVREDTGDRYYDGCTLIVVTTGQETQRMIFHYQMEGKALRNPLTQIGSADGTI